MIYLSGPMSGYPEHNFPAFAAEAARLRDLGYKVLSPHEVIHVDNASWIDCLKLDIALLVSECNELALLPGWEHSRGACLEHHIAQQLQYKIYLPKALTLGANQ